MKRIISILMLAIAALQFAVAGEVVTKDTQKLPLTARNFILKYFAEPQISYIKIESGFLSKRYEVTLTDRTEIDFDKKGEWTDIDCKKRTLPDVLVPSYIKEYVQANFPTEKITKMERDGSSLEVELTNDLSLKFNKQGKLIRTDD